MNDDLTYDELCEAHDQLSQQLGEIIAEHRSETAMFGDSWPGAQIQIADMQRVVRELEARIEAHNLKRGPLDELIDDGNPTNDYDDIPF